MTVFDLITMLGGLALFLFGMSFMGESLEKTAGNRLKGILAKLTSSPFRGMLVGAGVTAVIQSSSATTVMVVGFVNSGIMQLRQAIGLIMGANIGTTITAWILSLTGLDGDAWYIQLLKPSTFTPVLGVLGACLYMFGKRERRKTIGAALLGFSVLMFGMDTMSNAVAPLADMPQFTHILLLFSNPILGVLAGTVLTAIIQSSSASVGILQALSATGVVTYGAAIPIIMGQNIGTCVTALISSIGATKNARRTAMVHLYFNIIGTVVWLSVFCLLNAVFRFSFTGDAIGPFAIAVVHSVFNLLCTALLAPFSRQLEKLVCLTIRDKEEDEEERLDMLDERLFSTPAIAVERCRRLTCRMARMAQQNIALALNQLTHFNEKEAAIIEEKEEMADQYEDQLGSYMVSLSAQPLSNADSRELSRLLHAIGDFERISDHALNILHSAQEMKDKNMTFSPPAQQDLKTMTDALLEILDLTISSFVNQDQAQAALVEPLEQVIDDMKLQMKTKHVQRLRQGECTIEMGFVYSDLLTVLERVSDHCSNIAAYQIGLAQQNFDTHAYLNSIKTGNDKDFIRHYQEYRDKYLGPETEPAVSTLAAAPPAPASPEPEKEAGEPAAAPEVG